MYDQIKYDKSRPKHSQELYPPRISPVVKFYCPICETYNSHIFYNTRPFVPEYVLVRRAYFKHLKILGSDHPAAQLDTFYPELIISKE